MPKAQQVEGRVRRIWLLRLGVRLTELLARLVRVEYRAGDGRWRASPARINVKVDVEMLPEGRHS